jgi:hypothetical protein
MERGCLHNVGISGSSVQCVRVVAKEESDGLGRLRDGFRRPHRRARKLLPAMSGPVIDRWMACHGAACSSMPASPADLADIDAEQARVQLPAVHVALSHPTLRLCARKRDLEHTEIVHR